MQAEVSQIIAFDASGAAEDINLHNLECFCRVLPISLHSKRHYHRITITTTAWPPVIPIRFRIFWSRTAAWSVCPRVGDRSCCCAAPDQVACYHRHFQSLLSRCYSLIQYTTDRLRYWTPTTAIRTRTGFTW